MFNKRRLVNSLLLVSLPALANAGQMVKLHGTIKNPISDSVSVSYFIKGIKYDEKAAATALGKDGSFAFSVPVTEKFTQLTILHGVQATDLIVAPDADLTMTLDAKDFDNTLKYSGKGAEMANFVAKHVAEIGMMTTFESNLRPALEKEPAEYLAAIKEGEEKELNFLKTNGAALPKDFKAYLETYLKYLSYTATFSYPSLHEVMKQRSYDIKEIPKENYAVLKDVPAAFNDEYVSMPSYVFYASRYFSAKLEAEGFKNIEDDEARKWQNTDSAFKLMYQQMPPKTAEVVIGEEICTYAKFRPIEKTEKMLAEYKKRFPKSENSKVIEGQLAQMKKMAPGKPAMDFAFKTIEGKDMKLSDLKGKVVLIDFWASWCGPCRAEMPHAREVEEHFKGKDVVFLYVSIDDSEESWKKGIEENKIEGMHTLSKGGWKSEVAKLYGVEGVPSYFLIDKNGKFALQDVPRPSETEKLTAEIEKLLSQNF